MTDGGRWSRRRGVAVAAALVAAAGLFSAYLLQARSIAVNSDGASIALQAWDIQHGNWLLHGWHVADVSFWPTELTELALIEVPRGLGPDVVHAGVAVTYTALVLLAALIARGADRGLVGWVRAGIAVVIMGAPAVGNAAGVLLNDPDHTGTAVPVLLVVLLLDRMPARWYRPVIVFVLLTLTQVADGLAIAAAAAPLAVLGTLRFLGL